jgi:2-methylisocitrate lyase-like PEP mutase family enzyme
MSDLLPIQTVTIEDIRRVVRESLRAGLDADTVADFVASVDWSHVDEKALPPIAAPLGQLEAWDTEYSEGDSTREQFIARLLSLLPEEERAALERAASAA